MTEASDAPGSAALCASAPGQASPSGDEEIFQLVCRHMRTIAGVSGSELEDLVQVAAERVFQKLGGFEARASLTTWIFRICYNVFLNQRRFHRRWLRSFTLSSTGEIPEVPTNASAQQELEAQEQSVRLSAALAAMSPKLSAVVTMHDLNDVSIDEIAELLEINQRTARSRLRNGRLELRRRLAKDPYFGRRSARAAGGAA